MKMVKGLLLGSVASLVAIGAAQAADLPVKAKAVEYVRICSAYGAGFWYIPGTDTCMKIGGYARADVTFNGSIHGQPAWSGDLGQQNRYRDYFVDRSRVALTIDTRTASDYGVVRTFMQGNFQFSTQGSNTVNPASFTGSPTTGTTSALLGGPGEGYVATEYIFLQFAGFTFGKSASGYATPWQGFPGNISSFLLGGQNTDTGVNNIQYTAQFGNGVSGTIGLDDPVVWDRTNVYNLSLALNATLGGSNVYAGVRAPDVVGNIRVDQAWGLFQISADAHEVSGSYDVLNTVAVPAGAIGPAGGISTGLSEISGHPDAKWGGSVMAALQLKNLPTGTGDDIKMDVSYAKGNTKNVIATAAASPSFAMFGGSSNPAAYQSVGFGATTDAVYLPAFAGGDGSLHLTESYGIRGAFNHIWDVHWSTSLYGSYSAVRNDGAAKAYICANYTTPAKAVSADYSCNPDYNVSQLGLITRWTPVKNLTFSAEVQWFHLDQKFTGTAILAATAPKPTARYEFKDQDAVQLQFRAQRNF
ncbi:MAG TPA: porin [Bradyrhizobium sp.]|nr:porin [Bradyrhizobium sp.]